MRWIPILVEDLLRLTSMNPLKIQNKTKILKTQNKTKIDSLNEKVTKLQTEVRSLTRNLKQKPENLDSPAVVQQQIERFSAELDKQYQSEKKRNASADSETDAVDQLTQLEKLLDSSPLTIDDQTKDRVKGLREMAQEMLNIKKGKEQYADLSPDQKGEKALEVAQDYQAEYGFELNDINGMRQEFIRLSIEINQQFRRQGESYKAKKSFDPEGGNQQNSTPKSEVNPSDHQSAYTDESKAEPSISGRITAWHRL